MANNTLNVKKTCHMCINSVLSDNKEERLRALKDLAHLLTTEDNANECFYFFNGTKVLLIQLAREEYKKVAQSIIFALACSADGHAGNKKNLQNTTLLKYLFEILKHPNILSCHKFLSCSLMMMSALISENSVGQKLIKKHGCLTQMISMFEDILKLAKIAKYKLKESTMITWEILCRTLGASVNNPINTENQLEVSLLIPKTLEYLSSLDYNNERVKKHIYPCLNFLMLAISGNENNQQSFAKFGGIQYFQLLLKNYRLFIKEWHVLQTCLMVLDVVVVSNDQCSREASRQNIMPFLLVILQEKILKNISPLILLLCHLLQNNDQYFKSFKEYNGLVLIQECIKNGPEDEDLEMLVKYLLEICLQRESDSWPNGSLKMKPPNSLTEEGANGKRSEPDGIPRRRLQQSRNKISVLVEDEIAISGNKKEVTKPKNYNEVYVRDHSSDISVVNKPQVIKHSLCMDTTKLNGRSILSSGYDQRNNLNTTSRSLYCKDLKFKLRSIPRVHMANLKAMSTGTQTSQSAASAVCHNLSSCNHSEKFSKDKQCQDKATSTSSLLIGSKLRMHQLKNSSCKNHSETHANNKPTVMNSNIDACKDQLQNCINYKGTSTSQRKRSYSLIKEATPHRNMCSINPFHGLSQGASCGKCPLSNFKVSKIDSSSAGDTLKKSALEMVIHTHTNLLPSESEINASSKITSGGKEPNKISMNSMDVTTCMPSGHIGRVYSNDTSNLSNVTNMTDRLKPLPHCYHHAFLPPTDNGAQKFQNKTLSGCFNNHKNKIPSKAMNSGQQRKLPDIDSLSNGNWEPFSSPHFTVSGGTLATSSLKTQGFHKLRHTICTGCMENPEVRDIPSILAERSQNNPLDLSISSNHGTEAEFCKSCSDNVSSAETTILSPQIIENTPLKEKSILSQIDFHLPSKKHNHLDLNNLSNNANKLNPHSSLGSSKGSVSNHSKHELISPNEPASQEEEIIEISQNKTLKASKECRPLSPLSSASHDTTKVNSHTTPDFYRALISLHVTPSPQIIKTNNSGTNFEITLITPNTAKHCQINDPGLHQTPIEVIEVSSNSSCKSSPKSSSTPTYDVPMVLDTNYSENIDSAQRSIAGGVNNDSKQYSSNKRLSVGDAISHLDSVHTLPANDTILHVKNIEKNSVSCNKSLASATNQETEGKCQKILQVPKGIKRILSGKRESIRQIPLSIKEVENLQAGIKKFGLHFGTIRKSYAFLPIRTSKDLFLAWKELHHIIGYPAEHQVNEKMLGVSSDGEFSSE